MASGTLLFEGSTKKVLQAETDNQVVLEFKDSKTNFDGEKRAEFKGKGAVRLALTKVVFEYLESYNIPTHWGKVIGPEQVQVKKMDMLPIRVLIRNIAAGSLCERFNIKAGMPLKYPVLEYYLKDEVLGNPMISESHAYAFDRCSPDEMKHISRLSSKVNAVLKAFMERRKLKLVDYTLEFGRSQKQIYLADEITPDNARLWYIDEGGTLKQNHFRLANSKAEESFREILERLTGNGSL